MKNFIDVCERQPAGLGHEGRHLRRVEHIEVDRDIRTGGSRKCSVDGPRTQADAVRRDEVLFRWIEVTGSHERDVVWYTKTRSTVISTRPLPEGPVTARAAMVAVVFSARLRPVENVAPLWLTRSSPVTLSRCRVSTRVPLVL